MNKPLWHKEALERGITEIKLVYDKANGFVFCPGDLEKPFRIGGDYEGSRPVSAGAALQYFTLLSIHGSSLYDRLKWFLPFLRKVSSGISFSLDELELDKRNA